MCMSILHAMLLATQQSLKTVQSNTNSIQIQNFLLAGHHLGYVHVATKVFIGKLLGLPEGGVSDHRVGQ